MRHNSMYNKIELFIMANFNYLQMANALLAHEKLTVKSTLFGLRKQLVYFPTGSSVKVIKNNYHSDAIAQLQRIMESEPKGLAAAVKAFRAKAQPIGNVELDICISGDKNFVALQMLQFGDEYAYHPITEPVFFEGEQAQLVSSIL